jgi:hypothetical protein
MATIAYPLFRHHFPQEAPMERRDLLRAGFSHLAQALTGLVTRKNVGTMLIGSASAFPHRAALSFPQKVQKVADPAQKSPVQED